MQNDSSGPPAGPPTPPPRGSRSTTTRSSVDPQPSDTDLLNREIFLARVNELLGSSDRAWCHVTTEDLNLFEHCGLVFPFIKSVSTGLTRNKNSSGDAPNVTYTGRLCMITDPEYERALRAPRDSWNGPCPLPLTQWIRHANKSMRGTWKGDDDSAIWHPDPGRAVRMLWYLSDDIPVVADFAEKTTVRQNVLVDTGKSTGRVVAKRVAELGVNTDSERDLAIFRLYLEELPAGRGVWGRVADRAAEQGTVSLRDEIVDAANKQTKIARSARERYRKVIRHQVTYYQREQARKETANPAAAAVKIVSLKWGCAVATIRQVLE